MKKYGVVPDNKVYSWLFVAMDGLIKQKPQFWVCGDEKDGDSMLARPSTAGSRTRQQLGRPLWLSVLLIAHFPA